MNKKILGLTVALFASVILFSAMPVRAEPTNGQKVPVTSIFFPPCEVPQEGDGRLTAGGIFLSKGRVEIYRNNRLYIGNDPYLTVCAYLVASGVSWNPTTEVMDIHWESVWYISTEGSPDGFAGNTKLTFFGYDPNTKDWDSQKMHCVLHGFGAYEGQTLMLSYKGLKSSVSTGYCLKG